MAQSFIYLFYFFFWGGGGGGENALMNFELSKLYLLNLWQGRSKTF